MSPTSPQNGAGGPMNEEDIAAAFDQDPQRVGIASLVGLALDQGRTLISAQIELIKLKVGEAGRKFGAGAVLAIAGLILLFYFLSWIFRSVELAFALIVPAWAAALITAGIILVLIIILVAVGLLLINRGSKEASDVPAQLQTDMETVKEGIQK